MFDYLARFPFGLTRLVGLVDFAGQHAVLDALQPADDGALCVVLGKAGRHAIVDCRRGVGEALNLSGLGLSQKFTKAFNYVELDFLFPAFGLGDELEGLSHCLPQNAKARAVRQRALEAAWAACAFMG